MKKNVSHQRSAFAFFILAVLAAGLSWAESAVRTWMGTETTAKWTDSKNWQDGLIAGDGDTADFSLAAGVSGVDTAVAPQTVTWSLPAATSLAGIYGGLSRRLQITVASGKTLTLSEPNDFFGVWTFLNPYAVSVNATAESPASLDRLDPSGGAFLTVPTAGTEVVVSNLVNLGTLVKQGDGTLRLVRTAGTSSTVIENAGSVAVEGVERLTDADLDAIFAKAAFHVDADDTNSFEFTSGDDPRVSKWCDVRGADNIYASQLTQNGYTFALPRRVENFIGNHAVVDFGHYQPTAAEAGTDSECCALVWSTKFSTMAEAFVVVCNSDSSSDAAPVFCHTDRKIFYRGNHGSLAPEANIQITSGYSEGADMRAARDGFFSVDGKPILGETPVDLSGAPKLVTFTTRKEGALAPFGSFAAQYGQRTGGVRIGEAVYFTSLLTDAERTCLVRYLLRKWKTSATCPEAWDIGSWQKGASADATISVAADKTLGVRTLQIASATLTKAGDGTLELGSLDDGANKNLVVSGGTVRFAARRAIAENPQPAANAYRHFDASDSTSFVGDENGVTEWKDASGDSAKSAKRIATGSGSRSQNTLGYPQIVAGACNGRSVLSFGTYSPTVTDQAVTLDGAAMLFCPTNETTEGNVYEGFVVCRKNGTSRYEVAFLFGPNNGNSLDFYSGGSSLFRDSYASPYLHGGLLTLDGKAFQSLDTTVDWCKEYHVIRFSTSTKVCAHGFCEDRNVGNMGVGGWSYGEVLLYDRPLTDAERIETEAYLMKKWLGTSHPLDRADSQSLDELDLASGTSVASEVPLAVDTMTLADSCLDLAAMTNVTIGSLAAPALTEIRVGDGETVVPFDGGLTEPIFRFDAGDTAGMTLEDGTNVVAWLDANRTGAKAASFKDRSISTVKSGTRVAARRHPALTDVTINGRTKTVVDFGVYHSDAEILADSTLANETAAMTITNALGGVGFTTLREVMAFELLKKSNVFAFTDSSAYNFHRGGSNILRYQWAQTDSRCHWMSNALVRINNAESTVEATVTDNSWYNFDFASLTPGDNLTVGTFALDRTSNYGGLQLAEAIGFDQVLSDKERAYWQNYLEWKWRGVGTEPVWTNATLQKVSVAAGGSFAPRITSSRYGVASAYCVGTLSGAGTFAATATGVGTVTAQPGFTVTGDLTLENNATLALTVSATGAVPLTVGGRLTAGALTLTLSPESDLLPIGTYPLVKAGTLDADVDAWTLSKAVTFTRYVPKIVRSGNTVNLVLLPRGLMFLIR